MDAPPPRVQVNAAVSVACCRCNSVLDRVGSHSLREPGGVEALGVLGQLLARQECLEVYLCSRCGRVELFAGAAGEDRREAPVARGSGVDAAVEKLLREAQNLEAQDEYGPAMERFAEVLARYPGTNFARDAERRLCILRTKYAM
jgi:hypothetical protein